jgi:predicted amidophosphoribosyltransferase
VAPHLWDLSEAAIPELVAIPVDGQPESCWRCRTWTNWETGECWNCNQNFQKLGIPAVPLDMISLYEKPSQLRDWLTRYKGRLDDESEPFIPDYVDVVKALIARYFQEHGDRIVARSPVDVITVVPSSSRPAPHPLESLLNELPLTIPVQTLLRRGPGELGFNHPSRDGYLAVDAQPQRVLLVDDVETTGARINSAAYTLIDAGHTLAGAFVVARRINVGYKNTPAFWEAQKSKDFTWSDGPLVNSQWSPT